MAEGKRKERAGDEVKYGRRDDSQCVSIDKSHPLAGKRGEGPPLAPPGWVWRVGKRVKDVYFISPSGDKFRSQMNLRSYLETIPNPPPMSAFCWNVLQEFKDGVLPGVLTQDRQPSVRKKARLGREYASDIEFTVRKKDSESQNKVDSNSFQNSNNEPAYGSMTPPEMMESLEKAEKPDNLNAKGFSDRAQNGMSNASFSQLLLTPTSYKVLSKNARVLQRFLKEAALLKEKDEKEIGNLRSQLLLKNYSPSHLNKYPESVLRVFFYILRNEEAPATIGKGQLIEFCTYWICKHKHHWCLLETRPLDTLETLFSDTLVSNCRRFCQNFLTLKEHTGHCVQGGKKEFSDLKEVHNVNRNPNDCAARSCVDADTAHGIIPSKGGESTFGKGVIESLEVNEVSVPENGEASKNRNLGIDYTDRTQAAGNFIFNAEDSCCSKETNQMNPGEFELTRVGRGHTKEARLEYWQPVLHKGCEHHANKCSCEVCSSDPTFCYGCTCNLCKLFIQHSQAWTFLNCPACRHFCHLECAVKARRAGVVADLGIDGEYLCLCSNKSDMVPFWVDTLKNALSSIDRPMVQKYLTSAVVVFNGTHREVFQSIHQSVLELHDSLLYNIPCSNLQQILRQIREKVDCLSLCLKRTGPFFDPACVFGVGVQDPNLLQEEKKLPEALAWAELRYIQWLTAEKSADTQRVNLRNAQEEMEKAEADIRTKAERARSSRTFIQQAERSLMLKKQKVAVKILSKEHLGRQRTALKLKLVELNKVRNQLCSFSAKSHERSAALEEFKIQSERVEAVKARLEKIDPLYKHLL